tara:strand:+ start:30 stop:551 length:522 start_codon:yes stop_codon:yes gene_type:complete
MKKLSQSLFKFFILIFFILSNPVFSEIKFIKSTVENVIITDGDSIKIGKEKIRLFGIDAPEIKQVCYHESEKPYACGRIAKLKLEEIIKKSNIAYIYCFYSERDKYKRILAECFLGENSQIDINQQMVFRGHAVAYLRYSKKYLNAQEEAKSFKFGLWAGKFDLPEEWRKNNK